MDAAIENDAELDSSQIEEMWEMREMVHNAILSRSHFLRTYNDPRRDIEQECGHVKYTDITRHDYKEMFNKFGIAARLTSLLPMECWQHTPSIYEKEDEEEITEFEAAWGQLCRSLDGDSYYQEEEGNSIWDVLCRADVVSGIGRFGIILLGIDDGKPLEQPITGFEKGMPKREKPRKPKTEPKKHPQVGSYERIKGGEKPVKPSVTTEEETGKEEPVKTWEPENNLIYLRVLDESLVEISEWEMDKNSPRYMKPKYYNLTITDPERNTGSSVGMDTGTHRVHWSRVIHIADNVTTSDCLGASRMQDNFDRLQDLRKLLGGSAEMYWRGAFFGLSFETHPNLGGEVALNMNKMKANVERFMNTLQRVIVSKGMTAKPLAPQVVDPTPQIKIQITALCVRAGIPERIFMGSERGQLASAQDDKTWNGRLKHRQRVFITPNIIVPFVDRMVHIGVLPEPEQFYVEWPDLDGLRPLEKADITSKRVDALSKYLAGGLDSLISPIDILTREFGYNQDEAQSILNNAMQHMEDVVPDTEEDAVPGHMPKSSAEKENERLAMGFDKNGRQLPKLPDPNKKSPVSNALDLLMTLNNCGTGSGGFKKGNDCAGSFGRLVPVEIAQVGRHAFASDTVTPNGAEVDVHAAGFRTGRSGELLHYILSFKVKPPGQAQASYDRRSKIPMVDGLAAIRHAFSVAAHVLHNQKPDILSFTASEDDAKGRVKLYSKGAKLLGKMYGYRVEEEISEDGGWFKLVRNHTNHKIVTDNSVPDFQVAFDQMVLNSMNPDAAAEYLLVINANCGTGKGGFKKGNKCAKGGGSSSRESVEREVEGILSRSGRELATAYAGDKLSRKVAKELVDAAFGWDKNSKKQGGSRILVTGTQGKHNRPFSMSFKSRESMQRWAMNNRPHIHSVQEQLAPNATTRGRLKNVAGTALKLTAGVGAAFATAVVAHAINRSANDVLDYYWPKPKATTNEAASVELPKKLPDGVTKEEFRRVSDILTRLFTRVLKQGGRE